MSKPVGNRLAQKLARQKAAKSDRKDKRHPAPARTVESRENQLINLAVGLAEEQLLNGTASAQVITHYLKLGTTNARLEKERLERENELLKAKTDSLKSHKRVEELYAKALSAMRSYSGMQIIDADESDDDDE